MVGVNARGTVEEAIHASAPSGPTWPARIAGWALIAACVLLVAVGILAGERTSSYGELRAAVERGDVDQVTVSQGFTAEFQGHVTVDVHWRTLGGWRVAQVVEQHPLRRDRINGLPVVYDVGQDLTARDPDVQVERRRHWREASDTIEVLGWRLPSWCSWVVLGIWVGTLLLIVGAAQPWRATRWAWFWLWLLAAPVGVVAFLLLGGPTGLLPPVKRRPWLTGGWALILAFIIGSAIGTVGD